MPAQLDEHPARDELVPLVTAKIPGDPHRTTRFRWGKDGVRRGETSITLKTVSVGGRRFTTLAWIDDFIAECSGVTAPSAGTPTARANQRRRQIGSAMKALADMGVAG